ncbi:MAG: acyltransferase family protein [Candidatus Hydrogenedentes bacterium]|nr:acyltransferase family protein [Candidatus Hydrogenedentota bacterium]
MVKIKRRYPVDWLRILVVASLVPFHTARVFDIWEGNYVKNDELSYALSYFISYLALWIMPLSFLLAGTATGCALRFRSASVYLKERFQRLFVPLLFGVLVLVPPQAFIARFQKPGHSESYGHFLRDYFVIRGDLSGYTGDFTPAHLWFILYLLVFSVAVLPLFLYLIKHRRLIDWLALKCQSSGTIFLMAVPLVVAGALPDISGKNPFFYGTLFIYGFIMGDDTRFQTAVQRAKGFALVLGILVTVAMLSAHAANIQFPRYSTGDILLYVLRTFGTWFWIIASMGYAETWLNGKNRFYRYANEASYPFYILHQTILCAIAFYVVQWSMNLWIKFFVISALTFLLTLLVYDLFVKRIQISRFLFGMKIPP